MWLARSVLLRSAESVAGPPPFELDARPLFALLAPRIQLDGVE